MWLDQFYKFCITINESTVNIQLAIERKRGHMMDQNEPLRATTFCAVSTSPRGQFSVLAIWPVALAVILILVLLLLAVEKNLLPVEAIGHVGQAAVPIHPSRRSFWNFPQEVVEGVLDVHHPSPSQIHPILPNLGQCP